MVAMKRMSRLIGLLLVTSLFTMAGSAASSVGVRPVALLWRIDGGAIPSNAPQYLFGTIHIPDPRVTALHPVVEQAFAGSEVVLTELKLDMTMMTAAAEASMLPKAQKLSSVLTASVRQQLETELKAISPQLKLAMFDRLKPWALATQLVLLPMQLKHPGVASLDLQLAERAEREGKRNEGLEQLHEQLGIFERLSQAEQMAMLQETLTGLAKARQGGKDVVEQLTDAYLSGDESEIERLFDDLAGDNEALNDKLSKALIDDRNRVMTERLIRRLRQQGSTKHFVAVGAAHLIGEKSMLVLLRAQGFTVTRVQ